MGRYPKEKFRKARRGYALLESVIQEGINEGLMSLDQPLISYSIWAQLHGIIDVVLNKRLDIEQSKFIKEYRSNHSRVFNTYYNYLTTKIWIQYFNNFHLFSNRN